ncbi:GH32 C-terminal domain-containing protein [Enterococcus olivae]
MFTLGDSEKVQIFYAKDKEVSFEISYDSQQQLLTVSRENIGYEINGIEETHLTKRQMPVDLRDSKLQIEMFRDTSTMEIFVNRQQTISMTFYDNKKGGDIQIELGNQSKLIQFSNGKIDKHKK